MRYKYAIITPDTFGNLICTGTVDTPNPINEQNYLLDEYPERQMGKCWIGSAWTENPNPPEEPEQASGEQITNLQTVVDTMLNGGGTV